MSECKQKRFVIPSRDDDLLEDNEDFYTIQIPQPTADEVVSKVFKFRGEIASERWTRVIDRFDYLFFTLKQISESEPWRLRVQLVGDLNRGLKLALQSTEELLPMLMSETESEIAADLNTERETHARAVLIYVYMLCRLSVLLEKEVLNRQLEAASSKKGRKVVYESSDEEFMGQWVNERGTILRLLRKIFEIKSLDAGGRERKTAIRFLWQPSIIPPELLKIARDIAFKFLENPDNGKASGRDWLQSIFGYLKVLCTNYNECAKIGTKLVSLMKRLEYLSTSSLTQSPFVDAIESVDVHGDMDPLFQSMLSSLGRLSKSDFARTDVSARPFSLFIVSLAERKPQLLNQFIVSIAPFLCDDPATLRCAVLSAFVEIVIQVYKGNLPEGSARRSRDRLLVRLQDHIMDMNALVRSRALQLWARLAKASQIPLAFLNGGLIPDAGGRLIDKSVSVRKSAATFLSAVLEFNPFGASLNADDLAEALSQLMNEKRTLQLSNPEYEIIKKAREDWIAMKSTILEWITRTVKQKMGSKTEEEVEDGDNKEKDDSHSNDFFAEEKTLETDDFDETLTEEYIIDEDVTFEELVVKVIHALETRDARPHAVKAFVRAALDGRIPTVNKNGSVEDVISETFESLQVHYFDAHKKMQSEDDEEMLKLEDRIGDYRKIMDELNDKIKLHEGALTFSISMENCLKTALGSVMIGQANELTEVIHYIVATSKFGIRGSEGGVRELCRAIWRRDNAVKEIIVKAAKELFISENQDRDISARKSAENLIKIVLGISEEERVSVEEVLCLMFKEEQWNIDMLDVLSVVVFDTQGASRVAALRLFSIMCRANKNFMRKRLNFFIELTQREGFFENDNGALACEFFNAIAMLGSIPNLKQLDTISEPPFRLPESHQILQCAHAILVQNITNASYSWIRVMQKAISAIFYVALRPSLCCRLIVSGLLYEAKHALAKLLLLRAEVDTLGTVHFENPPENVDLEGFADLLAKERKWLADHAAEISDDEMEEDASGRCMLSEDDLNAMHKELTGLMEKDKKESLEIWELVAERICFLVGEIALKTLVHIDVSFVMEMKRKYEFLHVLRSGFVEAGKKTPVEEMCIEDFPTAADPTELETQSIERTGFFDTGEQEDGDRLGLTGMSVEDCVLERAQRACEVAVSSKGSFLCRMSKFLLAILNSKKGTCSERLRSAAILALTKVMLISMKTCLRYMPLFWEYFENSSPECRSNLMVAAADLCSRFPNIIEKYSERLYHGINSKDDYVRQTCIIVLSYLMLNDMIKLRGTVADLALCIIDENVHVGQLTKYFFSELSKKNNVLYNLMPDIISRLSSNEYLSIDNFLKIMKLLLAFIKKDKHADSLIEKLLQRMQGVSDKNGEVDARLAECLASCISCLPLSEKSFHNMVETLPTYANLLSLPPVYSNLQAAVTHFRKSAIRNTELKSEVDEFLEKLTNTHEEKKQHVSIADRSAMHKKKCKPATMKSKMKR